MRAVRGWGREGNGFLCLMRPMGGFTEKVESEYLGEPDFQKQRYFLPCTEPVSN